MVRDQTGPGSRTPGWADRPTSISGQTKHAHKSPAVAPGPTILRSIFLPRRRPRWLVHPTPVPPGRHSRHLVGFEDIARQRRCHVHKRHRIFWDPRGFSQSRGELESWGYELLGPRHYLRSLCWIPAGGWSLTPTTSDRGGVPEAPAPYIHNHRLRPTSRPPVQ